MNIERLTRLANFLETVPREHFDLSWWSAEASTGHRCGTFACAGGWACAIPEFREAGLRAGRSSIHPGPGGTGVPLFEGFEGYHALRKFFGLTELQEDWIFNPDFYPWRKHGDPMAVVKRIRSMVKRAEKRVKRRVIAEGEMPLPSERDMRPMETRQLGPVNREA